MRERCKSEFIWKFFSLNEWQFCNILSCNAWIIYWSFLCPLFWIFATFERLGMHTVLQNMYVLIVHRRILHFLTKLGGKKPILRSISWKGVFSHINLGSCDMEEKLKEEKKSGFKCSSYKSLQIWRLKDLDIIIWKHWN